MLALFVVVTTTLAIAGCGGTTPPSLTSGERLRWSGTSYRVGGQVAKTDVGRLLGVAAMDRGQQVRVPVHALVKDGAPVQGEVALQPATGKARLAVAPGVDLRITTWKIGPYTVREVPLPASFLTDRATEDLLGTTLFRVSSSAPYVVTATSLVTGKSGTTTIGSCTRPPVWETDAWFPWTAAALLCTRASTASVLYLLDVSNGDVIGVSPIYLPPCPANALEYAPQALGFVSGFEYVLWAVASNEAGGLYGDGITNLQTGKTSPVPASLETALYVSPNGTLFRVVGKALERWSGRVWTRLGPVVDYHRVEAVGNDGTVWASRVGSEAFSETLVEETAGSTTTHSWAVRGGTQGYGPGYVVWTPHQVFGPPLKIFFAPEDKTMTFPDVSGQPQAETVPNGGLVAQIPFRTTSGGAAAIEISVSSQP